ncbi:hypothetical protein C923_04317 [Plasmodium falciparum UGT5.1]|uniref:Surface antigen n=1 Tax=Plasmodium falciparum UGT5.1 TaxID=1237627 RepID=W7J7Q7_PLAFA|nr:hypothetical protein C923_04317 [Plasmodium falciparum UGT5.1]
MPEVGSIGATALYALNQWLITATSDAIAAAEKAATALATQAGVDAVVAELKALFTKGGKDALDLSQIVNESTFNNGPALVATAKELFGEACIIDAKQERMSSFCTTNIYYEGPSNIENYGKVGADVYKATYTSQKGTLEAAKVGSVNTTYAGYHTSIIASIAAVVVIVLIMVIIYLILYKYIYIKYI